MVLYDHAKVVRRFRAQGAFPEATTLALGFDCGGDCCSCFIKVHPFEIAASRGGGEKIGDQVIALLLACCRICRNATCIIVCNHDDDSWS